MNDFFLLRSRDHGNAGYNAYRTFCGLCTARHFGTGRGGLVDHRPDIARKLRSIYSYVIGCQLLRV